MIKYTYEDEKIEKFNLKRSLKDLIELVNFLSLNGTEDVNLLRSKLKVIDLSLVEILEEEDPDLTETPAQLERRMRLEKGEEFMNKVL